jgi:Protein phosphatase 2C
MSVSYQSFGVPKRDSSALEYEDAAAAAPELHAFAIADGATDSSFAGLWAQLLVEEFVRAPANDWRSWLPPLQQRWEDRIGNQALPWYAEAKLRRGAFATFLGVVIDGASAIGGNCWHGVAVGDCCLFQIRQQSLHGVFPNYSSEDFNNNPSLVGSRTPAKMLFDKNRLQTQTGAWQDGDQLWLMTDALAKWFLLQQEADQKPCETVARVLRSASSQDFTAWIDALRTARAIRDDDVTLLAVNL